MALWWPEDESHDNGDIDLLVFRNSRIVASSTLDDPVTQRVVIDNPVAGDDAYRVMIRSNSLGDNRGFYDRQDIFYSYTLTKPNNPPVAYPETVTVEQETTHPITLIATDRDRDIVTFHVVDPPDHGKVSHPSSVDTYVRFAPSPQASVNYLSDRGFEGADSFTVRPWDGLSYGAAVPINVWVAGTGPSISIRSPSDGQTIRSDSVRVSGSASDPAGVDRIVVALGGASATFEGSRFSHTFTGLDDGMHTFTVTAWDEAGNTSTKSVTVTIMTADTSPPRIIAPRDIQKEATGRLTPVSLGTPRVSDDSGSFRYSNNAPGSFPVGTTIVTWTATDPSGNIATDTQKVTIRDTTPPVIRLAGDRHVSLFVGSPYSDLGATATDIVDGVLTGSITTSGTVNTNSEGTYHIRYSVSDSAGNTASASRVVTVDPRPDSLAPVLTVPPDAEFEASGALTRLGPSDYGAATATDDSGSVTVSNNAPASFPLGATIITWTATDSSGNISTGTQVITVSDSVPPSVLPPDDMTVGSNGTSTVLDIGTAVASDAVDGSPVITSNAPDSFPAGLTIVTWTATDYSGNTASAAQSVMVLGPIANGSTLFSDGFEEGLAGWNTDTWSLGQRSDDAPAPATISGPRLLHTVAGPAGAMTIHDGAVFMANATTGTLDLLEYGDVLTWERTVTEGVTITALATHHNMIIAAGPGHVTDYLYDGSKVLINERILSGTLGTPVGLATYGGSILIAYPDRIEAHAYDQLNGILSDGRVLEGGPDSGITDIAMYGDRLLVAAGRIHAYTYLDASGILTDGHAVVGTANAVHLASAGAKLLVTNGPAISEYDYVDDAHADIDLGAALLYDATPLSNLTGVRGLAVSGEMILAGDTFSDSIMDYAYESGVLSPPRTLTGATLLVNPSGMTFHGDDLVVADNHLKAFIHYSYNKTTGVLSDETLVRPPLRIGIGNPVGIASYNDRLLVINPDRQMFDYVYDGSSATDRRTLSDSIPAGAASLTFYGDLLLVGSPGSVSAYTYDERAGTITEVPFEGTAYPRGLAAYGDQLIMAERSGMSSHRMYVGDGAILTDQRDTGESAGSMRAVTVSGDRVFAANTTDDGLYQYVYDPLAGTISDRQKMAPATNLRNPSGITVSGDRIIVSDNHQSALYDYAYHRNTGTVSGERLLGVIPGNVVGVASYEDLLVAVFTKGEIRDYRYDQAAGTISPARTILSDPALRSATGIEVSGRYILVSTSDGITAYAYDAVSGVASGGVPLGGVGIGGVRGIGADADRLVLAGTEGIHDYAYIPHAKRDMGLAATVQDCSGCHMGFLLDTTGYAAATINFERFADDSLDADDSLVLQINGTAISSWTGGGSDAWSAESVHLPSEYLDAILDVRFVADSGNIHEDIRIDDVSVTARPAPPPFVPAPPPQDTAPPVFGPAPDIRASSGVVSYLITAWDAADRHPTVSCTPDSGSVFGTGTTTVTCTASDSAGNTSSVSFRVIIS